MSKCGNGDFVPVGEVRNVKEWLSRVTLTEDLFSRITQGQVMI